MKGLRDWVALMLALVPAAGGLSVLAWAYGALQPEAGGVGWETLAKLVVTVGIAFGVAAVLRFALAPLMPAREAAQAGSANPDSHIRVRIAPLVLGVGSAAIVTLALGLMLAFTIIAGQNPNGELAKRLDSLLMGVFSAVLPVFATWVGTVLAFYFTNESFRQAADSTRETLGASTAAAAAGKLWGTPRVIDFEKITRRILEVDVASPKAAEEESAKLDLMWFKDVFDKSATASRVIVFDSQRHPIFVVRKRRMPASVGQNDKLDAYLKLDGNAADAKNFRFLGAGAALAEARSVVERYRVLDIFITDTGKAEEPTKGWTTDDLLAGQ